MIRLSILNRAEAMLAGSFLTLAAIWFSGNKQYDDAAFIVMAGLIFLWIIKAVTRSAGRSDHASEGAK